jgi:hypothetical protein
MDGCEEMVDVLSLAGMFLDWQLVDVGFDPAAGSSIRIKQLAVLPEHADGLFIGTKIEPAAGSGEAQDPTGVKAGGDPKLNVHPDPFVLSADVVPQG